MCWMEALQTEDDLAQAHSCLLQEHNEPESSSTGSKLGCRCGTMEQAAQQGRQARAVLHKPSHTRHSHTKITGAPPAEVAICWLL